MDNFHQILKDGNYVSDLTSWVSWRQGVDYVLRFVVDNWEYTLPTPAALLPLVNSLGSVLAVSGDLGVYRLKSVLFKKIPVGTQVQYFEPAWYVPQTMGDPWTDTLAALDSTWTIDIVFSPVSVEKSLTEVARWKALVGDILKGTRGIPKVGVVGLLTLAPDFSSSDPIASDVASRARVFWASIQPFNEFRRKTCTKSDNPADGCTTGYSYDREQIYAKAPDVAWNKYPPYVGTNGVGIATGDALDAFTISPLPISGTVVTPPADGASLFDLTSIGKAGVLVLGLFAGWFGYQKLAKPR